MHYLKNIGLALTLGVALALSPAPHLVTDAPATFAACAAASYVDQSLQPLQLSA